MVGIIYSPFFLRKLNGLEGDLQDEVAQKIDLFKNRANHKILKVHKLHGRFSGRFAFSVNYKFRIAFRYVSKNNVLFLDIGDHDIYK